MSTAITAQMVKELRERTSAGMMECKNALTEANGNIEEAILLMRKKGQLKAAKRASKVAAEGIVVQAISQDQRSGIMLEINCETDFVARTDEFKNLAHEIAMQVAAMDPRDVKELEKQEYIRDTQKTISDLIRETIAKVGENIVVKRFERFEIGL